MWDWLRRLLEWIRRILRGLPTSAVRRAKEDLEQARASLRSAQDNLEIVIAKLKKLKSQPNPDPRELGQLEGDEAAFRRRMDQEQRHIDHLERRLDALDPDGSIRASLP